MKASWVWLLSASTHAAVMIMALLSTKRICSRFSFISCLSPQLPLLCYCSLVHVKNKQSKYNHFWIKTSLRQLAVGVNASFSEILRKLLSLEKQSDNNSTVGIDRDKHLGFTFQYTKAKAERTKNGISQKRKCDKSKLSSLGLVFGLVTIHFGNVSRRVSREKVWGVTKHCY